MHGKQDYTCEKCGQTFHTIKGAFGTHRAFCGRGADLFWPKVDKSAGPDGCWLYMGFRKWDGYGWLARKRNGKSSYLTAHRYAWILTNGEVPDGLHVLHRCDNPPCCNPAHLFLGTHQDNMADKARKGRFGTQFPDRVRPERKAA